MYSSLHKIDIVVDAENGPQCVQTDHRDRAEIETQPELSVVFGVTRMLAPGLADASRQNVQYVCMGEAPPFLRDLIRACGATLSEHGEKTPREPAGARDLERVERVSHDALMALGRAVLARHGLEASPEGLQRLEEIVRDEDLDVEENEIHYYEQMVELAAAAGVVIAGRSEGARWRVTEQVISMVPLALDVGGGQLANVFGRTERFFEGEVAVGPAALVEMYEQRADAPVVGILKPATWAAGHPFPPLVEPLLGGEGMPILAYAHDQPNAVAYINATAGITLDEARAQTQAFYQTIDVTVERLSKDLPIWLVTGNFYAPEKLLDRGFARELHTRLETETLLIGFPTRGVAAVVPVRTDPKEASVLLASFINRAQERAAPAARISTVPFIMMNGEICGHVALEFDGDAPEQPRKRGFFRRLFGG